jgi:hypothetical protein
MAKTQFEALIEHIINDNEEAARELLHDIVVAKSREIYNEMMEDEPVDEAGGDMTDDMIDDVEADEEGMSMDDAGDELGDEMGVDGDDAGEMGDMDDMGGEEGEGDMEDRIVDLEAALDDLKAEFDQLMAQEEGEPEHDDMGVDDFGGDDMGGDMDMEMGSDEPMPEGMVREYVEKVAAPAKGEGQTVGSDSSSKPSVNTKSVVAGKNDMGGSVKNLNQGGSNAAPDGNSPPKAPSNAYKTNNAQEIDVAKRNVNQVGGNKGASNFYSNKAKAKTGEESGTNDTSIIKKL